MAKPKFNLKINIDAPPKSSEQTGVERPGFTLETQKIAQVPELCEKLDDKIVEIEKKMVKCDDAVLIDNKCHIFDTTLGQGAFGTVYGSKTIEGFVLKDSTILSTLEFPCDSPMTEVIGFII